MQFNTLVYAGTQVYLWIPSANISLSVWEIKGPVCHYSLMALGSPSGQCHMAYIGTPAPLIFPRTMAQLRYMICPHYFNVLLPILCLFRLVLMVFHFFQLSELSSWPVNIP